jgi:hypothetical protein
MNQVYDMDLDDDANRQMAEKEVEEKFRKPLRGYTFPPRADVLFEGKCLFVLCQSVDRTAQRSTEALHTNETGKHQAQVKALIEKTASSLDDASLKMLFVSVQQNNIELCIQNAIY